jgi:hypothetical protein
MASLPFRVSDCFEFECELCCTVDVHINYRSNRRLFNDPGDTGTLISGRRGSWLFSTYHPSIRLKKPSVNTEDLSEDGRKSCRKYSYNQSLFHWAECYILPSYLPISDAVNSVCVPAHSMEHNFSGKADSHSASDWILCVCVGCEGSFPRLHPILSHINPVHRCIFL